MAAPKRKHEEIDHFAKARAEIRKMERAELERRIADLHKRRAAVSDEELEEFLEDLTPLECVLLADPYDDPPPTQKSNKKLTFQED